MDTSRFWMRVEKSESCWLWTGARTDGGYGVAWNGQRYLRAHRVAYELTVGPIPTGLNLMHTCDNPPCVRPDHLKPGTQRDNLADMTAKGRRRSGIREQRGSLNAHARLTEQTAYEARVMYASGVHVGDIAARYGVNSATIRYLVLGKTWTHVPMPKSRRPPSPYRSKLTAETVAEIRSRLKRGDTRTAIAADFGVSAPAISALALGRTHRA